METKKMKRSMIGLCLFMCTAMSAMAQQPELIGKWIFKSNNAPYGYESGTVQFAKGEDGNLSARLHVNSNSVQIKKIEKKADKYVCSPFYLEGEEITITFQPKAEKIHVTAEAGYDVMQAEMVRAAE